MSVKDRICFYKLTTEDSKLIISYLDDSFYNYFYENTIDNVIGTQDLYNIIIVSNDISLEEIKSLDKYAQNTYTSILHLSDNRDFCNYANVNDKEYLVYLIKVLCRISWVARINKNMDDESISERYKRIIDLLGGLDKHTKKHSSDVLKYVRLLGTKININEKDMITLISAAYLHDIGKTVIPREILTTPRSLTVDEYEIIKLHTVCLDNIIPDEFKEIKHIIRHHHEKWDGSGYPDKLIGTDIPLLSRIITVVDAFDAMTSKRIYNTPLSVEKAIEVLRNDSETHFDKEIVEIFISILDEEKRVS